MSFGVHEQLRKYIWKTGNNNSIKNIRNQGTAYLLSTNLRKKLKLPKRYFQGLWRRWFKKKPEIKISWHCPFKLSWKLSFLAFILSVFFFDNPSLTIYYCKKHNSWLILITLSFISFTPSKALVSSGSWLTLQNFEIYYLSSVIYDPTTTDLIFIRVNIYPGPGMGGLQLIS